MLPRLKFRREEPTYLIIVVAVAVLIFLAPQGLFGIGASDAEAVEEAVPAERSEP